MDGLTRIVLPIVSLCPPNLSNMIQGPMRISTLLQLPQALDMNLTAMLEADLTHTKTDQYIGIHTINSFICTALAIACTLVAITIYARFEKYT